MPVVLITQVSRDGPWALVGALCLQRYKPTAHFVSWVSARACGRFQVAKGLAYPVNGVVMGGLDWRFSTVAMWSANAACVACLAWGPKLGMPAQSLTTIWIGLAAFMWTQVRGFGARLDSSIDKWHESPMFLWTNEKRGAPVSHFRRVAISAIHALGALARSLRRSCGSRRAPPSGPNFVPRPRKASVSA